MVESRREKRVKRVRAKKPKPKWYFIKVVFWSLLLAFGFVMFMFGWYIGEYL